VSASLTGLPDPIQRPADRPHRATAIGTIVGGVLVLAFPQVGGVAMTLVIGVVLLVIGLTDIVVGTLDRPDGTDWAQVASGAAMSVAGYFLVADPLSASVTLTAILIAWLIVDGLLIALFAVTNRSGAWGVRMVAGVATVVLGVVLWRSLPNSGTTLLGIIAGIALIVRGVGSLVGDAPGRSKDPVVVAPVRRRAR
jgi:uncharacterized membrane protein HdeD (DUF308 family)